MSSALKTSTEENTLNKDVSTLCHAFETAKRPSEPYPHFMLENLFDEEVIDGILNIPFSPADLDYTDGTREQFNAYRRYLNPEVIAEHEAAQRVANALLSPDTIATIEKLGNINLKDTLLRIEYAIDTDRFWLAPHTDLGVKKFTMLTYLSREPQAKDWGTDIYYSADNHYGAVPFKSNTALMFIPSDKTWHGFERRTIDGIRKSLIINFVTQEWRNRHELVHPTQPVY